jgi:sugar phosphate isomerase/epimerase
MTPMRLGLCSFAYAWAIGVRGQEPPQPLTAVGLLDKAAAHGLHLVQVADNLPLEALSAAELSAFSRHAEELGIAVQVGMRGLTLPRLRAYLEIVRRVGANLFRAVIDTEGFAPSAAEIAATLRAFVPQLERAGVTLALENHDRLSVDALARLVRGAASARVGVCLDTANSLTMLEGPGEVVETLGLLAVNLHLKDVLVRRNTDRSGLAIVGCPLGEGQVDVPAILAKLHGWGRDVDCLIEQWMGPAATLAATLTKEEAWVRQGVAYLRQYIRV